MLNQIIVTCDRCGKPVLMAWSAFVLWSSVPGAAHTYEGHCPTCGNDYEVKTDQAGNELETSYKA